MTNTNTEQNDEWTAPLRKLIASLRSLEHRFKNAAETIRQYRPDEEIGVFPSLEGLETMGPGTLGVCEVMCELAVKVAERRADELQAEAEDVERVRAETLRRQNQSPLEAKVEALERALAYQGAELAKLRGPQSGRLPALPHVARADVPQFLGMPGGMGRHAVGQTADSGVRKIGNNGSASAPDTAGDGFTRRIHPLNVIGGGGRR
jgi:hypothetical protein